MMTQTLEGKILGTNGWIAGHIHFNSTILSIEPDESVDRNSIIIPGFIDCHVHGGGGFDCMDGEDAVLGMTGFHNRFGTTSILPTTLTAPVQSITDAFDGIGAAMRSSHPNAGSILGVHLEGPFINERALGAQPPFAIPPDIALAESWHEKAPISIATIAPETDPGHKLLAWLTSIDCRPQIGHSCANASQAMDALENGITGFTHLYNQMTGLHHRDPGCVGAALACASHAELILDFHHVDALAAGAAIRAIPDLYGVTDAISAAGMTHGEYRLGTNVVSHDGETARLADGTLAGSVLTMDRVFANFMALGLDIAEASRRCSTIQADYLGLNDRGLLAPDLRADINVINEEGELQATYVRGVQAR